MTRGLRLFRGCVVCAVMLHALPAAATSFAKGALIIPMDTTFQDRGMLKAYGLLYRLLKADIPVHWVIMAKKKAGQADFSVAATDLKSGATIASHKYRGGPFVVDQTHAASATTIVNAWQQSHTTAVHRASSGFVARTARLLTAAPTIAVIADGNEDIAFGYLNAAAIPDSKGNSWSKTSPGVHTTAEVAGPTTTKHNDGALFRGTGQPAYCQIMTMHWDVKKVVDEVVAEYRAFLQFPTHMMAECQAVNAVENNKNGRFLTPNGFLIDNKLKETGPFSLLNQDTPFVQMDGTFALVGGSERAYSLPAGDKFHDRNVVMIKDAAAADGQRSIWMTGYIDGKCIMPKDDVALPTCKAGVGKVSYLGGHRYEVKLPISKNPKTQGTRLFLNSLFEASCTTREGQPALYLSNTGPAWTTTGEATYTLSYGNSGPGSAIGVVITTTLPSGASYVSSTGGGKVAGDTVSWSTRDIAPKGSGTLSVSLKFATLGDYTSQFNAQHKVGQNRPKAGSNVVTTAYVTQPPPDAGPSDAMVDDALQGDGGGGAGDDQDDGCSCRLQPGLPGLVATLPLLALFGLVLARRRRRG